MPRAPATALTRLSDSARELWTDAAARRSTMETIAWHLRFGRTAEAAAEAGEVDAAVADGLQALGFGRETVTVEIAPQSRGEFGAKTPQCVLLLSGRYIQAMVQRNSPDTILRTWIHESMHARLPFTEAFFDEWEQWRGYEEGLAEGLARLITRHKAGMRPLVVSYGAYVNAYLGLARVLGVAPELLWRSLYEHRNGTLREKFPEAVEAHLGRATDPAEVRKVADELFASSQADADTRFLDAATRWRSVLR